MIEQTMNNAVDKSEANSFMSQFAGWFSDPTMLIFLFILIFVLFGDGFGGFGTPGGFLGGIFADPNMIILVILLGILLFPGLL